MTIRNRPNYSVFNLNLTDAGALRIPATGTRVALIGALFGAALTGDNLLSGGTPTTATVNVLVGSIAGEPIPFQVGTQVNVENKFDAITLSWNAQNGVFATIVVSDDADGNGIHVSAPPSVILGNMTIVQGGNTALVNANGQFSVNSEIILGGSVFGIANPTAVVTQILAPASNLRGCDLRTLTLGAAAGETMEVYCDTAAPTVNSDTTKRMVLNAQGNAAVLPQPIFLPAGIGIWAVTSQLNNGGAWGSFDLR